MEVFILIAIASAILLAGGAERFINGNNQIHFQANSFILRR